MIHFDHIGIEARDAGAAAHNLAEILDLPRPRSDGADDDMFRLDLAHDQFLLFSAAAAPNPSHIAFRVERTRFRQIVERLQARARPFGNDPEDPANGRSDDPLGGGGRVYFGDENGHLYEVTY